MQEDRATLPRMESIRQPRTKPTITAALISCEDAAVIEACLQSVAGWVDEIVVADMHSSDGTQEIVRRYNARLVEIDRLPFADPARDYLLSLATCDWTIMVDPDERVPLPLSAELQRIAQEQSETVDIVQIPFQQVMFGTVTESLGARDGYHPRFFKTGTVRWDPAVHGTARMDGLKVLVLPERGNTLAMHHDTWRSIPQVVEKLMRYAPKDVENLQTAGVHFSVARMLHAGIEEFLRRMFFGRAWQDGFAGLLAVLYFTFYKLTIYGLLWEAEGRSRAYDQQVQRWGKRWSFVGRLVARYHRMRHRDIWNHEGM